MTDKEKAERYDELQKWFWWLERRRYPDGSIMKYNVQTFLKGIKKYFEPYKEQE